jgi:tyrosine-protein phosphatase SIW14
MQTASRPNVEVQSAAKKPTNKGALFVSHLLAIAVFAVTFKPLFATSVHESPPEGINPPAKDLPNFERVHSYLYRGGQPSPDGVRLLKKMGVKTIIDLREAPHPVAIERHVSIETGGINHVNIPMGNFIPSAAKQAQYFRILDEARQKADGPVFVHCAHGSDRTGFMVALWRVNREQWSIAEAFGEMLRRGFQIHKFGYKYNGGHNS